MESSQASDHQSPSSKKKKKLNLLVGNDVVTPPRPRPERIKVKLEVVHPSADQPLPIVAYFPSGYQPTQEDSITVLRNSRIVKPDEKRKGPEKIDVTIKPSVSSNVEFVGSSYTGEASSVQLCSYAIGVLNKEDRTLKIVPIAANKIIRLDPKIHRPEVAEPPATTSKEGGIQKEDKLRDLTKTYGTKKSQNRDKKKTALNRGTNPEAMADLEKTIENAPVNKKALESTSSHVSLNVPPHNLAATTPQEAYPIEKIIFAGEWGFLDDIYQKLQSGDEFAENSYPSFVMNRLQILKEIQDETEQRTFAQIFSYITHLVKFKEMHTSEGFASARKHKIPNILKEKFVSMFNPDSEKWLPIEKRQLLTSYVLVLTLHWDHFQTKPDDISKDLRMNMLDLRVIFEKLGCKLRRDGKSVLATLPLPLKFPEIKQRKRKRAM